MKLVETLGKDRRGHWGYDLKGYVPLMNFKKRLAETNVTYFMSDFSVV
jgi:hypothetical protein